MKQLVCPRCMANCTAMIEGWCKCTWCRWQGRVGETAEATAGRTPMVNILEVTVTLAGAADVERGLLAFVAVELAGGVRLDGLTIRKTREGRVSLTWPARRDRQGRMHPMVRLAPELHQELEQRIIEELATKGATAAPSAADCEPGSVGGGMATSRDTGERRAKGRAT